MFREMRRKDKAMEFEAAEELLRQQTNGVLACLGDDGYPYAVPLSYAYAEGKIYAHGASAGGHKLDAIAKEPKVSFCVVARDEVVPKSITTKFASVIAFGKARILPEGPETDGAIQHIFDKYTADFPEESAVYLEKTRGKFVAIEIDIEHMTGKATRG